MEDGSGADEDSGHPLSGIGCSVPPRPTSVPFMRNIPGPQDGSGMHRGYVPDARGIKTHRHTLVFEDLQEGNTTPLLFDDDADPFQMNPLPLEENSTLVKSLCDELRRHCERMNDPWSLQGSHKNETYCGNRSPVQSDGVPSDKQCGVMRMSPGCTKHEGATV